VQNKAVEILSALNPKPRAAPRARHTPVAEAQSHTNQPTALPFEANQRIPAKRLATIHSSREPPDIVTFDGRRSL
jgi:hypothetical protein